MTTHADAPTGTADSHSPLISVKCPGDGRVIGAVPDMSVGEIADVARSLRLHQPAWEDLGPAGRSRHLRAFLDWVLDNERRLVTLIQEESGKSWGDSNLEIGMAVDLINYYTEHAEQFLADRRVKSWGAAGLTKNLRLMVRPHPLVGLLTPWNGPLGGPLLDGIPALAAGCAVLCKPSEVAPLTWVEATRGWTEDVGAPAILGTVTGGPAAGEAVVDLVDMIAFTGSPRTGRLVAARASARLIPISLELGGKDAMIVLSDADIDRASSAAVWGAMYNAGQACISVERVYVEAPVYDEFVTRVVEKTQTLRVGMDPAGSFQADIGALETAAQLATVERHVEDAVARGARVLVGGKRAGSQGYFYEPTVLVDVDHEMLCMKEETFGPTIPVMKVPDEDTAVRLANDSVYGLSSSVWTADAARAQAVARRIEAGAVIINNVMVATFMLPLPMQGWKTSGIGSRSGGASGMLKYCRQKSVVSERVKLKAEPHWYPYTKRSAVLQSKLVRLLGAHDWKRRLGRK